MAEGLRIKVGLELDVGWYLVTEILEEESRKGEGTGSWLISPVIWKTVLGFNYRPVCAFL